MFHDWMPFVCHMIRNTTFTLASRSYVVIGERGDRSLLVVSLYTQLSEYCRSIGVTFSSSAFNAVPDVSSTCLYSPFRFSFYHAFVDLVNFSSLLIMYCNLLCSFHRICIIFGQVDLKKCWSSKAYPIVLHRAVDVRRSQHAPCASYLGSL